MPQELKFNLPYKSINSFKTIEIPNFCLVTGKNGSGKSHLLEAIAKSSVKTSLTDNHLGEIALFDSVSIVPNDTGNYSPANAAIQENDLYKQIEENRKNVIVNAQNTIGGWGGDASCVSDMDDVIQLAERDSFLSAFRDIQNAERLFSI